MASPNGASSNLTLSQRSPAYKAARPFVVGGIAACAATCVVQPIDMVKVRLQLAGETAGASRNPLVVTRQLIAQDGFMSLYKGLSAGILRQLTYGVARLGIFRTLTNKYTPKDGTPMPVWQTLAFSLTAGGVGALIGTPADAALVRMQADSTLPVAERRGYKNAIDALIKMARQEGLNGFFAGAAPTVYRGLAINVGMFMTYDNAKRTTDGWVGKGGFSAFLAGSFSGWAAATVALPFDFVKTRLQKQKKGADGKLPYKNFVDCARKVAAKEGITAFYSGYPTFVVRITPHIMLTWVFMDAINRIQALK